MLESSQVLESFHARFCVLTGHELKFPLHERVWFDFHKAGFTEDDLRCVIHFMLRSNAKHDYKYSLKIHNVIGDLERFDSILGEARAIERNQKKPSARQAVLEAFRGKTGEGNGNGHARHISEFLHIPKP